MTIHETEIWEIYLFMDKGRFGKFDYQLIYDFIFLNLYGLKG